MINQHPTQQQIISFANGDSEASLALLISAHVDMCEQCRQQVAVAEEQLSTHIVSMEPCETDLFENMMADILTLPASEQIVVKPEQELLELDGRKFALPRALQKFIKKTGSWSRSVGKLWQAQVDLGALGYGHFIFMEKDGRVPEHTHRGNELTLVLDGKFSDGIHDYDTGDFILMNEQHTHTPVATVDEGCLVFTIVEKPLYFTSGLARLLNPFSHLFFKTKN